MKKRTLAITLLLVMTLVLAGCRNETQNRIRRSIQDFTNARMYITLYSLDGATVYEGLVDGKVTRASATLSDSSEKSSGNYIFWFDDKGQYHQTDLPYLLTTFDRNASQ